MVIITKKGGDIMLRVFSKRMISIYMIIILVGFITGYIYYFKTYKSYPKKEAQYAEQNRQKDVLAKKIIPNGKLIFETKYLENGEIVKETQLLNYSLYGKSRDEISRIYNGWDIKSFSDNEIVLYKEKSGLPPGYYIISNIDGFVSLLKSDENGGKELVEKTDISVDSLSPNNKERVLKNIIVKDKDEAYQILANLSS